MRSDICQFQCCSVEWISKIKDECEILIARSLTSDYHSSTWPFLGSKNSNKKKRKNDANVSIDEKNGNHDMQ